VQTKCKQNAGGGGASAGSITSKSDESNASPTRLAPVIRDGGQARTGPSDDVDRWRRAPHVAQGDCSIRTGRRLDAGTWAALNRALSEEAEGRLAQRSLGTVSIRETVLGSLCPRRRVAGRGCPLTGGTRVTLPLWRSSPTTKRPRCASSVTSSSNKRHTSE
jgi:hypothetical protein